MEKRKRVTIFITLFIAIAVVSGWIYKTQKEKRLQHERLLEAREDLILLHDWERHKEFLMPHIQCWSDYGFGFILYELGMKNEERGFNYCIMGNFALKELLALLNLKDASEEEVIRTIENELACYSYGNSLGRSNSNLKWDGNTCVIESGAQAATAYLIFGRERIMNDNTMAFVNKKGESVREEIAAYDTLLDIPVEDFLSGLDWLDRGVSRYRNIEKEAEEGAPRQADATYCWRMYISRLWDY